MGYGLLKIIVPVDVIKAEGGIGLCVTMPNVQISIWQAFGVEFFATSALIWFCCGVWDPRNAHLQDCTSLKFGLAVAGLSAVTVCIVFARANKKKKQKRTHILSNLIEGTIAFRVHLLVAA